MSGETILCCIFQMHCKLKWIVKTRRSEVQLKFSYIKSPIIKKQLRECRFHRVEEQEERGNRILWARKRNCCLFTHNSLSVCVFLGDKKSLILWLLLDPFSLSSYLNIILKPNLRKKKTLQNNQPIEATSDTIILILKSSDVIVHTDDNWDARWFQLPRWAIWYIVLTDIYRILVNIWSLNTTSGHSELSISEVSHKLKCCCTEFWM